ncbi:MAG TPA: VWA domain-containing protein [Thermoanaerobaculia bacterium]|nr:VWA domain-containing protein [Thermoanaerobaculia bacterium]
MPPVKTASLVTILFCAFAEVSVSAELRFVTPLERSQVLGPTRLEVFTDQTEIDRVEFYVDEVLAGVAKKAPFAVVHDFGDSPIQHRIAARLFARGYSIRRDVQITSAPLSLTDAISVDVVEVPIRLLSPRTAKATDLVVTENGTPQTVIELNSRRASARFTFIIDRSLSMGNGKLQAAMDAVDQILRQMRPDDEVQVLFFNHQVGQPETLARGTRISSGYSRLRPSGGTALRDAVAAVQPAKRTYAVVISDGSDRSSRTSAQTALRKVGRSGVVLYAVTLGQGNATQFLEQAAQNSGGSFTRSSTERLASDVARVVADINSRYTIIYQSNSTTSGWRSINVTPVTKSTRVLGARAGYFAE